MALVFTEGFDNYQNISSNLELPKKWTVVTATSNNTGISYGRNSGWGIITYASSTLLNLLKIFENNYNTLGVGFALRCNTEPASTTPLANSIFLNIGQDSNPIFKMGITSGSYSGDYRLFIQDNNNNTVFTPDNNSLFSGSTWNYVEVLVTAGNPGSYLLRIEERFISSGSLTLTGSIGNYFNSVRLLGSSSNNIVYLDDFYVTETSGTTNNGLLGNVRIDILRPNTSGSFNQWTSTASGSSVNANWTTVDEADTYTGLSDFTLSSTSGQIDMFHNFNLPYTNGTIYSVNPLVYANKLTSDSAKMKLGLRVNSTSYFGSDKFPIVTNKIYQEYFEKNPETSQSWTVAEVNNLESGYLNNSG